MILYVILYFICYIISRVIVPNIISCRSCDLVKAAFIDILTETKSLLCLTYPTTITHTIKLALSDVEGKKITHVGPRTESVTSMSQDLIQPTERKMESSHNWSHGSVDLQMSRCNLLLDQHEPLFCDETSLMSLLSQDSMYEVHHRILSSDVLGPGMETAIKCYWLYMEYFIITLSS